MISDEFHGVFFFDVRTAKRMHNSNEDNERQRQSERETETETETERGRHRDREAETERERWMKRKRDRQTFTERHKVGLIPIGLCAAAEMKKKIKIVKKDRNG